MYMYRHVIWNDNIQNYHQILIYPPLLHKLPSLFRVRNSLSPPPPQLQINYFLLYDQIIKW